MSRQQRVSELLLSRKSGAAVPLPLISAKDTAAATAALVDKHAHTTPQIVEQIEVAPPSARATRSRATTPVRAASSASAVASSAAASSQLPSPSPSKRKAAATESHIDDIQTPSKKARSKGRNAAASSPQPAADSSADDLPPLESVAMVEIVGEDILVTSPTNASSSTTNIEVAEAPMEDTAAATSEPEAVPEIPTAASGRSRRGMALLAMTASGVPQPPSATTARRSSAVPPPAAPLSSSLAAIAAAAAAANLNARTKASASVSAAAAAAHPQQSALNSHDASAVVVDAATSAAASSMSSYAPSAGLVATPFRSSSDLQSRLSGLLRGGVLPFPTAMSTLLAVFHAIDTVLLMERGRGGGRGGAAGGAAYPASWNDSLQPSVQRLHPRTNVSLSHLQQLLTLYPSAYTIIENHRVNKFGKLTKDYRISFATTAQDATAAALANPDVDDKAALEATAASVASSRAALPLINLESRRKEIETRMLNYIYQQHQRYLQRLLRETQHDSLLAGGSSAASAAASSVPTPVSAIQSFLSSPLSSLRCWYPSFSLDSVSHCPLPALAPLPDRELTETLTRAKHTDSGAGLLQLANRRQPVPLARLSLASEMKGEPNSTSHGEIKHEATSAGMLASSAAALPAAISAAAASDNGTRATAAASSAAAAAPVNKNLSILSSDLVASFRANLEKKAAASLTLHGSPVERERLRQLLKLRPLYESITFATGSLKRFNIPLGELLAKIAPGGGEAQAVRASLALLISLLPGWARLDVTPLPPGSPQPVKEVLRVTPGRACIDPNTGRDKFLPILEQAVRECENNISARTNPTAPAPAASSAAATSAAAASSVPVVVKSEPSFSSTTTGPDTDDVQEIVVKREFEDLSAIPNPIQLAAAASSIASRAMARAAVTASTHTTVAYAAGLTASPLKSRTNQVSRAAAMALAASGKKSRAVPAAPAKPPAAGSLTARLGSMR